LCKKNHALSFSLIDLRCYTIVIAEGEEKEGKHCKGRRKGKKDWF